MRSATFNAFGTLLSATKLTMRSRSSLATEALRCSIEATLRPA